MRAADPKVSVVMATHDRPRRLAMALDSLARQSVGPDSFEVIAVDDGSGPETAEVLRRQEALGTIELRVLRHEPARGPGGARNAGWAQARAPLVAFMDDDCVADPDWLRSGLRACSQQPGAVVQGRVDPRPEEMHEFGPFSHTVTVPGPRPGPTPWFETCNIFYPRALLERLGGFDEDAFPSHGGEDADLGWRAVRAGAPAVYADDARAFHAVERIGPLRMLRFAAHWDLTVLAFARNPEIKQHFHRGLFWKWTHYALLRALVALLLPRRRQMLRQWLARPYVLYLWSDNSRGTGPWMAPYVVALDALELLAMVRGSIRYRTLVL